MKVNFKEIVDKLTLEEKAALCSGVTNWKTTPIARLGIPSVYMSDGPHGVRREIVQAQINNIHTASVPSTCFPTAVTLASSWDRKLMYEIGEALAEEAKELEVSTLLGPGINIKRNPLCGRNFEYFSEDPYLAGELSVAYTKGIQDNDVGVSVKHYAANSQEYMRLSSSSEIDERALREIYLYPFEKTVKEADPYTIMCAYNRVNGEYASQHKELLHDILKEEWGFKGIVISDWGAVDDRVKGIKAGLHLEMPSSNGIRDQWIVDAVKEGKLDESRLDEIVLELLEYIYKCDANVRKTKGTKANYEKNHILAKRASAEGSVLLKNEDGILPLKDLTSIAVIGELADKIRMQGTGSSKLQPKNEVSFLKALDNNGIKYKYARGYDAQTFTDKTSKKMLKQAVKVASESDTVILFIGLTEPFESEGFDRDKLDMPKAHYDLIDEIYKVNKNIIAVLVGGSSVVIHNLDKLKALLNVYLTGEAGGEATLDIISGKVNPSGKLAETFPASLDSILSTKYFAKDIAEYRESIFVGYRYFDSAKKDVVFPFGYGLSYTEFEYSNMQVSADKITENDTLTVKYDVKNIGKVKGKEICQLYVKDKESTIYVADKELKGFEKVELEPGETKTVEHTLSRRSFAFYNVNNKDFEVESGEFDILVGSSSRDIKLQKTVFVEGSATNIPDYRENASSYYDMLNRDEVPQAEFEAVLGRAVPVHTKPQKGEFTFNTCVGDFGATWFSRLMKRIAGQAHLFMLPKNSGDSEKQMVKKASSTMPIRNFFAMANGVVSYETTEGFIEMLNGKFFKGLSKALKGIKTNDPTRKLKQYPIKKD
ncbi:MAG TPA: glycoside hydrolase family 3 C-terminal domain-containing protein [Clostridia bacterium]|jgi:beta-glucosidase|nr:glycoside hydrolase family 3 C-terminal domain-containing protein [Clostridia bacterium]